MRYGRRYRQIGISADYTDYADFDLGLDRACRIKISFSRGHGFRSPGTSPTPCRNLRKSAVKVFFSSMLIRVNSCAFAVHSLYRVHLRLELLASRFILRPFAVH
jgi:hypothetical protein